MADSTLGPTAHQSVLKPTPSEHGSKDRPGSGRCLRASGCLDGKAPLHPDRVRVGRCQGWRDRGRDAQAQRPVPAAVSAHELGGGCPGHEVVGGSGQAGATANQEGAADDGARDPRDRALAAYAGDQRAGGREPASDRRTPRPAGHRFGASDQICQPVTIARRPRGPGRPHRMQNPQRGESSGGCRSSEPNHQATRLTPTPSLTLAATSPCSMQWASLRITSSSASQRRVAGTPFEVATADAIGPTSVFADQRLPNSVGSNSLVLLDHLNTLLHWGIRRFVRAYTARRFVLRGPRHPPGPRWQVCRGSRSRRRP